MRTLNLLGHAMRKIVDLIAKVSDVSKETVCKEAGILLLLSPSIKAGLDLDWNDAEQKTEALEIVCVQMTSLVAWIEAQKSDVDSDLILACEVLHRESAGGRGDTTNYAGP